MTNLPDGVTNAMFEQFVDGSPYSNTCPEVLHELAAIQKAAATGEIFDEVFDGASFQNLIEQLIEVYNLVPERKFDFSGENKNILLDVISCAIGKLIAAKFFHYLKDNEKEHLAEAHSRAIAKRNGVYYGNDQRDI